MFRKSAISTHKRSFALAVSLTAGITLLTASGLPTYARTAARTPGTTIIDMVDPSGVAGGNTTVGLLGSFVGTPSEVVTRINAIRQEACNEGVPDPRDSSRSLTPADYVPIQWDPDLEYIARIRAAEASIYIGHTRPSQKDTWSVTAPSGITSMGENLAWNFGSQVLSGVEQWYEEKSDWVNRRDLSDGAVVGHYTSMITPRNKYVGVAAFVSGGGVFANSISGEFSPYPGSGTIPYGPKEDCMAVVEVDSSALSSPGVLLTESTSTKSQGVDIGDTLHFELGMKAVFNGSSSWVFDPGSLTWTSSDPSVATVDRNYGMIAVIGTGTATITVTSSSGRSASAELVSSHTPGDWTVTKEATCTETGLKEQKCSYCGEVIDTEVIPAQGHKAMTDQAVAATCTSDGKTEGSHCSVCNTVLAAQQTIPATGHTWNTVTTKATTTEDGSIVTSCSKCNEVSSIIVIPYPETVKLAKSSCTYDGKVKKPSVIVTGSDGKKIASSSYSVKYASGRKKAGTYKVTVTFKGNYTGTVTKNFTIKKAKQTITAKASAKTYKASVLKKKKQAFSIGAKASGKGKLTYKSNKTKYVTVSTKGKVTIKKGTPKGTYKITVTAAATGNFKKATKTIKITVK